MASDATTFFWSFAAVFGGLAYYLLRLDLQVRALERRLRATQHADAATTVKDPEPDAGDAA